MSDDIWGQDLKITDWNFGKDLKSSYTITGKSDYSVISGADNLTQAIELRLLTPKGSYSSLGHPFYGSKLFELIGEINNKTNHKIAELYVKDALAEEKRIESIQKVEVTQNEYNPEIMDIHISILVIKEQVPLNLVIPFSLSS